MIDFTDCPETDRYFAHFPICCRPEGEVSGERVELAKDQPLPREGEGWLWVCTSCGNRFTAPPPPMPSREDFIQYTLASYLKAVHDADLLDPEVRHDLLVLHFLRKK